jgi:hypothetical protein
MSSNNKSRARDGENVSYFVYGGIDSAVKPESESLTISDLSSVRFDSASLTYLHECYGIRDLTPKDRQQVLLFALKQDEALKVTLRDGALTVNLTPDYKTLVGHVVDTSTEDPNKPTRAVGE